MFRLIEGRNRFLPDGAFLPGGKICPILVGGKPFQLLHRRPNYYKEWM